ncbi:MAG: phosphatase PAP2 family protein [Actinomycetia bacterium]|nr:phosphatase PAP2 family protein [Actinomycetes bacterium]MCP4963312.1 phosphatase PAP2 family protein [Actinomycetes bacterium]
MTGSDHSSGEPGPFGPAVDTFDNLVDEAFEPLRANAIANRVMYYASTLGDWSTIWHIAGLLVAVRRRDPKFALRLSATMGIESLLVNQGIKRLFGRVRPRRDDVDHERHIRQPLTSSFPSGHASAAMTAAAVLGANKRTKPAWYLLGLVVASSRIHVKMHHASDVAAGLITGVVLGRVANRVLRS